MSLTFSHFVGCLTVSIELLHVSHCHPWLLAVSHRIYGPMELLHFSHFSWLSLTVSLSAMELLHVSHCLFRFHRVAVCLVLSPMVAGCLSLSLLSHGVSACLSLSPIVAGCLLLSLKGLWSCCISLTVYYCFLRFFSLSRIIVSCLSLFLLVPCICCMCLMASHACRLSLTVFPVQWSSYMSLTVSHCCRLSLSVATVPFSRCMSLIVFYSYWLLVTISPIAWT